MKIPFAYGKILEDRDFTARTEEIDRLKTNFLSMTNTVVVSPRRWGKSSLIDKTIKTFKSEQNDILFVRLNIFRCETAQEFYSTFAKRIIEEISPSAESLLLNAKEFISPLLPKLTISAPGEVYKIGLLDKNGYRIAIIHCHSYLCGKLLIWSKNMCFLRRE